MANIVESKGEEEEKLVPLPNWIVGSSLAPLQTEGLVNLLNDLKRMKSPAKLYRKALYGCYSDYEDDESAVSGTTDLIKDLEEAGFPELVSNVKSGLYDHPFVIQQGETYKGKMEEINDWVKQLIGLNLQDGTTKVKATTKKRHNKESNKKPLVIKIDRNDPNSGLDFIFYRLLAYNDRMLELCQQRLKEKGEKGIIVVLHTASNDYKVDVSSSGFKWYGKKQALEIVDPSIREELGKNIDICNPETEIIILVAINLPKNVSEILVKRVKVK